MNDVTGSETDRRTPHRAAISAGTSPTSAVVFVVTLFGSAALLFTVELMIAKMVLPKFGGTAAVWNTCMVFFQAVLLAGYLYAHATPRWLNRRLQIVLHLAGVLLPLFIGGLL